MRDSGAPSGVLRLGGAFHKAFGDVAQSGPQDRLKNKKALVGNRGFVLKQNLMFLIFSLLVFLDDFLCSVRRHYVVMGGLE